MPAAPVAPSNAGLRLGGVAGACVASRIDGETSARPSRVGSG